MPNILYLSRFDESGAAPRYRVYQYFDSFQQVGITITAKPLLDIKYLNKLYFAKKRSKLYLLNKYFKRACFLLFNKSKYDLVLMDGELFPFIPFFLEKFFLPKQYIIDQDDAIFHTYDQHSSWIVRALLGNKISYIWKNSLHIIVGNAYVEEKARALGAKSVSVLPTVVDANKYKPRPIPTQNNHNQIIIGWVGSPTTVHALGLIKDVLINVAKKTNIALHVIGADFTLEGVNVVCENWKNGWSEAQEIHMIHQIDIGIMPLYDSPYEKGKCGFKLIKYMACAKPSIASPVSMNKEIIDHDKNGYLANSLEEWEKYLLMLIDDANKRKHFGMAGREKMLQSFSLQATAPHFCRILKQHTLTI